MVGKIFLRFCEFLFKLILSPFLFVLMFCIWFWNSCKILVLSLLGLLCLFVEWFIDSEVSVSEAVKSMKETYDFEELDI